MDEKRARGGCVLAATKVRTKSDYLKDLKKNNWCQWKASRLRSDWRARAKKLKVDPDKVPIREVIQEWLEGQKPFSCYLTHSSIRQTEMELDHKYPTSRGGSFDLHNVGITSKYHNAIKGSMSESEFTELLNLVSFWEDKGKSLFTRLRCSNNMFRRRWK